MTVYFTWLITIKQWVLQQQMSDSLLIQPLTWIQSVIATIGANFILTKAKFAIVKVTVGRSVVNFKKYLALQSRL
jgi:hypothetical protein